MTTIKRPPVAIGFLERKPRVGIALTLILLVLVGVAVGGGVGVLLTQLVHRLVALVAPG